MANKENKKTEVKNTVVDETNVLDTIKNGNKMPEGLADEVKKEIAEEEKKKKKRMNEEYEKKRHGKKGVLTEVSVGR